MAKNKAKNEKIKRKYFDWLRGAEGFSDLTIDAVEKAIWKYEEFTKESDYGEFNDKVATQFKKWLSTAKNPRTGNTLSLTSQYHILRHLNSFFMWLSGHVGYKSKVTASDIRYLRLSKEDSRKATSPKLPKYPSLSYIKKLCSFEVKDEIDRRDKALIAFTALSGMRDRAIITLPINCFDVQKLVVYQDPTKGVHTKFSKSIITTIFRFDKELLEYILDWQKYLTEEKLFTGENPLFPSTLIELESEVNHSFTAKGVEPIFWKNAGAMRKIFQNRAKETEVDYFSPHKFRHFAINEAQKYVNNAEELKAVSQNVGHENLTTTFFGYGAIDNFRVTEIIGNMNFEKKERKTKLDKETIEKLKDLLSEQDE